MYVCAPARVSVLFGGAMSGSRWWDDGAWSSTFVEGAFQPSTLDEGDVVRAEGGGEAEVLQSHTGSSSTIARVTS